MSRSTNDYDAIVVGAGPNGLAAAITLQQHGLQVLLLEAKDTVGGGTRTKELTLPGFQHDVCSAIHPMLIMSPFFQQLQLKDYGLELIFPPVAAAHPFDDGSAAVLRGSVEDTAALLGTDGDAYTQLVASLVKNWKDLGPDILGPLHFPKHPLQLAAFGLTALRSADAIVKRFRTKQARGLWAGMAAHSMLPFNYLSSAAIGTVLCTAGHVAGWPLVKGGSQGIANAMAALFTAFGGDIETNSPVDDLSHLPPAKLLLLDVSPRQLVQMAGTRLSGSYVKKLSRYRYGPGVCKVDWALDGPIPFVNDDCRRAGTVHIGNTYEEIAAAEAGTWKGQLSEKPFVLLAQQSLFDSTRAPEGQHTAWGYCHVPNGNTADMTSIIENQVERFAPGFKKRIVGRHVMNAAAMETYNANYIGGDINGGAIDISQLFTRPVLSSSPYRTSAKGIYLCSASTPPGGGVHGMCGYHAAMRALKDIKVIH
ncbi:NAD(P)/FAD-dependent oxidoreductase [Chitinophaga sp. sic0106]|uniref:phytoene desaturase family protein n=1 Tax=Chitinophaga sp. sic0106 TaxID=2854785 RepID=UPI001C49531A|nr:NAD(P)/FAD-dependent oxidoreductase [Chitinophaga sp. sic0106]MBV7530840.1 NAD(P)/FAD-dependent oxidoreductase [Chitinophaga sp. sic0106]